MDLAPFTTRKAALKCWVWAGASSPAPVGKARRGAPWAGGSGNGVDRPGPPPASSPSGGSGRGVGLGEVLQGPGGPPPRPAVVRVRLGAAAALLVVPCRGRTAWRSGSGGTRAGPWALDWGQVATGCLRGGLVGPSRSPARSAPRREAPASTIRRASPHPCRAGSTARGAGQGRFPHRVFDPDALRAQLPVHGCSHGDAATAVGAPWWSARGRRRGSRPGVDHGEGGAPAGPARRPLTGWPRASVVFGDRPVPAQRPPRS